MTYTYPHTIENCIGEKLTFLELQRELDGDRLIVENFVTPGNGPIMHTHWLQDECLTVVTGKIGYQILGGPEQFAGEGESILFERGTPHRFWNAGSDVLHCKGYVKPANSLVFFLTSIYAAQNKTQSHRPETFDAAFLMTKYASEFDMPELPPLVKKAIMPMTYQIGKLLGKYKHFKNAPPAVKS